MPKPRLPTLCGARPVATWFVLSQMTSQPNAGASYGAIGRSYRDAPEVDGLVFVKERVAAGTIVPVRITGAMAYDLVGQLSPS